MPGDRPTAPLDERLSFEDFAPGRVFDLGTRALSEREIVAFAQEWDPQPFHLDPAAPQSDAVGGLMASGWQTACTWMRMYVDEVLSRADVLPAPGVEEIRWLRPVRPGMRLHGRATILDAWPPDGAGASGRMTLLGELIDDDGQPVMTLRGYGRARRATEGAR